MRPRVDYRSASKEAYIAFKAENRDSTLTAQQYGSIVRSFNTALAEHILTTGQRIRLPFGLGELSISKYKPKRHKTFTGKSGLPVTIIGLPIDWQKTRSAGHLVYHLNAHTDGYRFRWKWFAATAKFDSARCFSFKANRAPSRRLAQLLKTDSQYAQMYREWNDR
jgi:hypothetical protein